MLLGFGLLADLIIRKTQQTRARVLLLALLAVLFLLTWAELAVGLFGTPFAGH